MISVPSADDTNIVVPKSNSQESEKAIKQNRRHTMEPVPSSKSLLLDIPPRGNVFQLSQSFSNNSNKFVSKTTISLSPNPPIKYAPNNSVTCDIKSNSLNPRPWKEANSGQTHSEDFLHSRCSETEKSPSASHLLQVKVNESENKILPNRIGINPNNTVGDFTCKITSACDNAERLDESDKVKIISDNTFKSRMMKFERMINTNDSKDDDITISGMPEIKAKEVNSDGNEEEKHYQNKDDVLRHARRKTISLPPSLVLSMTDREESRLSF